MKQPALEQIIQNARKGDQDAISELYYATYKYVYYIARQHLNSEADIQDVMQEVYSSVFGKLDTIMNEKYFATWLYKIVLNKCRNFVQRNRADYIPIDEIAELTADSEEILPAEWVDKAEKRQDIMRLIDTLPEGHRLAIILHYMNELSIGEVAEIMGITVEAVRNHLHHGRKAIKAAVLEEESKGNKLYGLVPMPVLARVFELEVETTVVPETVSQSVMQKLIENGIIKSAPASGAETNAANAGTHAAGMEAVEKGGLIKMFLGLSTGKKIGVIATALAVLMCLSLLATTLAAPTPTPTPTPTLTPKPGGNNQPNGPGGSGSGGGGGGTKPGDGPSGTGKPEATAPPKKETPPDEDNTPIEIEPPDDGSDGDIKPKKTKIKEAKYVWSITAQGTAAVNHIAAKAHQYFIGQFTLTLKATKEGDMFGEYKGTAKLDNNVDSSGFNALAPGEAFNEWHEIGSIRDLRFQLVKQSENKPRPTSVPSDSTPDDEPLAPLVPADEPLAPLDPKKDATMGIAEGSWTWDYHNRALFYGEAGSTTPADEDSSDDLPYVLRVYPGGVVSMYLDIATKYFIGRPHYSGRIAKKVTLVDVT